MSRKEKNIPKSFKSRVFITVLGRDRKGIVARISTLLYECGINIEDISQKIMGEYFVMIMLVGMDEATCDMGALNEKLEAVAEELNLTVRAQHEDVFKTMHRM